MSATDERKRLLPGESIIVTADPPPVVARLLALLLLAFLGSAALAATCIELPTTIRCSFVLVPEGGTDPVQAPWRGTVVRRLVHEGESVAEGTTLYVIRSDDVRRLAVELEGLRTRAPLLAERLASERAHAAAQREASAAEKERLAARCRLLAREAERLEALHAAARAEEEVALARAGAEEKALEELQTLRSKAFETRSEIFGRLEKVAGQGLRSKESLDQERLALEDARAALGDAKRLLVTAAQRKLGLAAEHKRTEAERAIALLKLQGAVAEETALALRGEHEARVRHEEAEAAINQVQATKDEEAVRQRSLERELDGTNGDLVPVRAPRAGVLVRLGPRDDGALVERGAMLCQLGRVEGGGASVLRAELEIPARAAGEVKERQSARLLYDAYPFSRFGAHGATVAWVSPAATGKEGTFRVLCELEDQTIQAKHERQSLRPGMGGQASIVTGRRTLLALALEPLRDLGENVLPTETGRGAAKEKR